MATGPKTTMILQTVTRTTDNMGGWTESWANTETMKGILKKYRGDERVVSGKENVFRDYLFTVNGKTALRAARTITEAQRFLYGSRTFDIVAIDDIATMGNQINIDLLEVV